MTLIDRVGHLVSVEAVLSSVSWQDEPATLMAFRHPDVGGGEVPVMTPEEAEERELAAEFAAEEAESAARVEALRLDADIRDAPHRRAHRDARPRRRMASSRSTTVAASSR